jgi:hypothetical protein
MSNENEVILQCPHCGRVKYWLREFDEKPGYCKCKSRQYWKVLKEEPKYQKGHVIVYSDKGKQQLHGPHFQEHPDAWIKDEQ